MSGTFPHADQDTARRYDSWFDEQWGRYAWRIESAAVLRALGAVSGQLIVDVGCGTGRFAALLTARGATVVGIDRDAAMLAVAALRVPGRLVRADAAALPLPNASVDAALAVTTLEFTTDPGRALAEMARVTRPGGRLVVAALNPTSLWGWIGHVRDRSPYRDARFISRGELLTLGRRHGPAHIRGILFAAERLPFLEVLSPLTETVGAALPQLGAVQILIVRRTGVP